jgi:SAM-dependent methyltransferase
MIPRSRVLIKKILAKSRIEVDASVQKKNILGNRFLFETYKDIYELMHSTTSISSTVIEIGAAGGITKKFFPHVFTSDVRFDRELNLMFDGENMPFKENSIDAIWAKDSLHHIPDTDKFLEEVSRVLRPGSLFHVCEPYWGPVAKILFKFIHPEPFSIGAIKKAQVLEEGNQAILYYLIKHNARKDSKLFDLFEIKEFKIINGLSFILSGGATMSTNISPSILNLIKKMENKNKFWMLIFGMNIYMKLSVKKTSPE